MKIVVISDTHSLHDKAYSSTRVLPKGDILIHAGDVENSGRDIYDVWNYVEWLQEESKKFKHVIQIAGNHDFSFERKKPEVLEILAKIENLVYLEDSEFIYKGLKFYGSPWQPEFYNWAFNLPRKGEALKAAWDLIPLDTDVLITHGPPHGILDVTVRDRIHVGCELLAERIAKLKNLKLHCFGHIHETYGVDVVNGVKYVNASICTLSYNPTNLPHIINIPTKRKSGGINEKAKRKTVGGSK